MLLPAEMKDMIDWIRLNREFMDFEIQDNNLWNNIDLAKAKNWQRSSRGAQKP